MIKKLEDIDIDDRCYVATYFMAVLPSIVTDKHRVQRCIRAICTAIRNGDAFLQSRLVESIYNYPESWVKNIVESLSDLTNPDWPLIVLPDGTPFLTNPESPPAEDEIPF